MADTPKVTAAQRHVLSRCSLVETWDRTGCTFGRQWPDLVAGRPHVSFASVRALVSRGLVIEYDDGLYGLSPEGVRLWLTIAAERTE